MGNTVSMKLPDTLLGFETTSPWPLWFEGWPRRVRVGSDVVALLWWWGVMFDLWIVVASIEDVAHVVCRVFM